MNKVMAVLGFVTLFGSMWSVTIIVYGCSTGSFLLGAKLGIVTSLSKSAIAKAHGWGWGWLHRKVLPS